MVAQDSSSQATAGARRLAVRQAIGEGHTFTAIAGASGITRQRVAQLAQPTIKEMTAEGQRLIADEDDYEARSHAEFLRSEGLTK